MNNKFNKLLSKSLLTALNISQPIGQYTLRSKVCLLLRYSEGYFLIMIYCIIIRQRTAVVCSIFH